MKIEIIFLFFAVFAFTASGYELGSDYWFTDAYNVKSDNGDEFKLTKVSDYHIEGRILGVRFYSDRVILSPVDVAIGTGKLSEEEYVNEGHKRRRHYFHKRLACEY